MAMSSMASSAVRLDAIAHDGDFVTAERAGFEDGADAIHNAVSVIAAAVQANSAWLVSRSGAQTPVATAQVGDLPDDEQLRESLVLSLAAAAEGEPQRGADGSLHVPVTTGQAQLSATLALAWHDAVPDPTTFAFLPQATELLEHVLRAAKPSQTRARAYEALVQIGTQIQAQEVHADAIFHSIVEHARSLLDTDVAWLGLINEREQRVRIEVASGASTPEFMDMEVQVGTGIGGLALQEGRAVSVREAALSGNNMPASVSVALRSEGVRSVLCAPMSRGGSMIGALYVGVRETAEFGEEATSLLSALAGQAAVAIENARLYQALSDKHDTLEQSFAIHRMLTDASLSGAGLDAIATELTCLLERELLLTVDAALPHRVVLYRRDGTCVSVPAGDDELEPEAGGEDSVAIMAGPTALGRLHAIGGPRLTQLQRKALEHGATVIALELTKEQVAVEVEWRMQAELLDELLRCPGETPDGLRARAQRAGIDLARARCVAVLVPDEEANASLLLETTRRTLRCQPELDNLVAHRGDRVLVALGDGHTEAPRDVVNDLLNRARLAGVTARCGLSRHHDDLAVALREAEAAVGLAVRSGKALVCYSDLGPLRFLLDAPDVDEMSSLVRELLGPLAAHDRERGADLMGTLRAFLESGGHHPSTCAACHIHVSTLKYRLGRIAAILGRPLGDATVRFQLSLAFEVLGVLDMLDLAPFDKAPASSL
jgi:sugar diacid utilization regulator/putative methionine-R-sulfoxide reductase with GAF domain